MFYKVLVPCFKQKKRFRTMDHTLVVVVGRHLFLRDFCPFQSFLFHQWSLLKTVGSRTGRREVYSQTTVGSDPRTKDIFFFFLTVFSTVFTEDQRVSQNVNKVILLNLYRTFKKKLYSLLWLLLGIIGTRYSQFSFLHTFGSSFLAYILCIRVQNSARYLRFRLNFMMYKFNPRKNYLKSYLKNFTWLLYHDRMIVLIYVRGP